MWKLFKYKLYVIRFNIKVPVINILYWTEKKHYIITYNTLRNLYNSFAILRHNDNEIHSQNLCKKNVFINYVQKLIDDCTDLIVAVTDQNVVMLYSSAHMFWRIKTTLACCSWHIFCKLIKARLFPHLGFPFQTQPLK